MGVGRDIMVFTCTILVCGWELPVNQRSLLFIMSSCVILCLDDGKEICWLVIYRPADFV